MASKARDLTKKISTIEEIQGYVKNCPTWVIVRYQGVTSNGMNNLRADLEKENSFIKIYKNTLVDIAIKDTYSDISDKLVLNNAFVFSNDEGLGALKVLKDFGKVFNDFEVIGGVFDRNISDTEKLMTLADLPNKEGLLSMLLSTLQNKILTFAWLLQEVAKKKEN